MKRSIIYIFHIFVIPNGYESYDSGRFFGSEIRCSPRLDVDSKPSLDSVERAIGTPAAFPSWLKTSVVGFVGACFPFQPCSIATTDPHAVVLLLEDREGELEFLLRLENAP